MYQLRKKNQERITSRITTISFVVVGIHLRHPRRDKTSALFMDDTNIWSVEDSMSEVILSLNDQVSKVVQWCSDNDVLINAKKSVVLFNSAEEDLTVKIGEAEVGPSQSGKYLGFQFK